MTPTVIISRQEIQTTQGADLSNSFNMMTDFVPGAWVTHDQLHVRAIGGVPIPNTHIVSDVGRRSIRRISTTLEAQRGGYSAAYGDRSYGVFDVVPRTGFERDKERELYTSFGTFAQINDQMNFGGHSENFAYFASVNGNRSNYGLATPGPDVLHDRVWGPGGNGLFHYNSDANNQFRFISSLRCDDYQIPNDPGAEAAGIRDVERERDVLRLLLGARLSAEPAAHRFTVLPFQSCQL
jgi:hypothetical protein